MKWITRFLHTPRQRQNVLVFSLSLLVIGTLATDLFLRDIDRGISDDKDYIGVAQFDFHQSPIRRYRILVPFAAAAVNFLVRLVLGPLGVTSYFTLHFAFYFVNTLIASTTCLLLFHYIRLHRIAALPALLGVAAIWTNWYVSHYSAHCLVDSLFWLIMMLLLVGLQSQNKRMVLWALLLGPLVKEQFVFLLPLLLLPTPLGYLRTAMAFVAGGLLAFGVKYLIDLHLGVSVFESIRADVGHVDFIRESLKQLFSGDFIIRQVMQWGLWLSLPVVALFFPQKEAPFALQRMEKLRFAAFFISIAPMLLSGDPVRFSFLFFPLLCLCIAVASARILNTLKPHKDNRIWQDINEDDTGSRFKTSPISKGIVPNGQLKRTPQVGDDGP